MTAIARFSFVLLMILGITVPTAAQDFTEKFSQHFRTYKNRLSPRIHITFHQPAYAPGDTIFYKSYLIHPSGKGLLTETQMLSVQLVSAQGKQVQYGRILMTSGMGQGYIPLSSELNPGAYALQAFTDEMALNNDSAAFLNFALKISGPKQIILQNADEMTIGVEGNRFVAGVMNKVVIHSATPFQGSIMDEQNAVAVANLNSDSEGWLSFSMTPDRGKKYVLDIAGKKYALPEVKSDGVALAVAQDAVEGKIVVHLRTPEGTWAGKRAYVIVTAADDVVFSRATELSNESDVFVPARVLGAGVNRVTLFSTTGEVIAERLFYNTNRREMQMKSGLTSSPGIRNNVSLTLGLTDDAGTPVSGNFSVSIIKDDLFSKNTNDLTAAEFSIISALGLSKITLPLTHVAIDNFLIASYRETIPWKKITGGDITSNKKANPYFFKASVIMKGQDKPARDSTFVTFYLNKYDVVFGLYVKNGKIEFPMFMNFEDDVVFYTAEFRKRPVTGVIVVPDKAPVIPTPGTKVVTGNGPDSYAAFSVMKQRVDQSFAFYRDQDNAREEDFSKVDWNVDFLINLDRIVPFPTMEETLHEVIPGVRYKKRDDKASIRVFIKETAAFTTRDAVFIIDGVMTDSADFFMSLNPKKLSRIGVIRSMQKLGRYGAIGAGGVVLVQSKMNEYVDEVPVSSHSLAIAGVQPPVKFTMINHDGQQQNRTPDIRSTLGWIPQLAMKEGKAEVKFATSDLVGRYRIVVEGMTHAGELIHQEDSFEVTASRP